MNVPIWIAGVWVVSSVMSTWVLMRFRNRTLRRRLRRHERDYARPIARVATLFDLLPAPDVDFEPLKRELVEAPGKEVAGQRKVALNAHSALLAKEFAGRPKLLHIHAFCIAILRRPFRWITPHARHLFIRIWNEEHEFLLRNLDLRWLASASATFADHGISDSDRRLGHVGIMLIDMIKLHETERTYMGLKGQPMRRGVKTLNNDIFDGLTLFSPRGDLIDNMAVRLLEYSSHSGAAGLLIEEIWRRVLKEDTVFRRLHDYQTGLGGQSHQMPGLSN